MIEQLRKDLHKAEEYIEYLKKENERLGGKDASAYIHDIGMK